MDNNRSSKKTGYYDTLLHTLMIQESNRPLSEQFPFVRRDIDTITQDIDKLAEKVNKICQYNARRSKDLEEEVNILFEAWLAKHKWNCDRVPLKHGKIYHNVDGKEKELVQWDGIYSAIREEDGSEEKSLFFIETKETSHLNFILDDPKSLYNKGLKTYEYLQSLINQEPLRMSNQDVVLNNLKHYSITVVFATGVIDEEFTTKLLEIKQKYEETRIPIMLMKATCPRISYFCIEELNNLNEEEIDADYVQS